MNGHQTSPGAFRKKVIVIYWIVYFFTIGLIEAGPQGDYYHALVGGLASLPVKIFFVYIVLEILLDKLLLKRKIVQFSVSYLLLLITFGILLRLVDNYVILNYVLTEWEKAPLLLAPPYLYAIIKLQFAATIPLGFKLFSYWSDEKVKSGKAEAARMQAELVFLRNQFHPHFIFNVLNSLYSKILTKSDESADLVLKISSLLRFSVYDANTRLIPLKKEICYLEDYIALQRIRFGRQLSLSFTVKGSTANKILPPFLIIPFIENCFKHGGLGENGETGWITIFITINDDLLTAKIENSVALASGQKDRGDKIGVGLDNVRQRLDLLYPGSFNLNIREKEDSYFVSLTLKLQVDEG